ncbi:Putative glycine reductase complex component b gamma subunit protein [Haloplasma contractile SSD-17B]|uniref:Glycine reductase complex component b gamma subunit protein n=3 Tax=Haloplasma TaxID=471824 RepID=U2EET3_9MOLU|nr:Putative glycine reductase complex component b gamma subunit protein [Haloplasma contractile SSD-17B]
MAYKVIHYINQFFANIGGEEMAHVTPEIREGAVGPGLGLNRAFKGEAEIVATVVCGDSYFNEHTEEATKTIIDLMKEYEADVFIAGPAFNAGRYGTACGTISKVVQDKLNIPSVTGMYIENPGADMFKKEVYIIETANAATGMRKALPKLAALGLKLAKGEEVLEPETEGYMLRGIRKNYFAEKIGAERAVDMLVKKLNGEDFETEYPMPEFDRVEPGKAIQDLSKARIALVTSGGIVPKGNPDRIESSSASKYGTYDISQVNNLTGKDYETAHGGYDPVYANEEPDRVVPLDVLSDLEKQGVIGSIHPYFYSTTGNGTAVKSSKAYSEEIAAQLVKDGVDAVILTST